MAKSGPEKPLKRAPRQNGPHLKHQKRSNDSNKPILPRKFKRFKVGSICGFTVLVAAYLFKKCYDVFSQTWTDQENQVWYMRPFNLWSESTELSFTDRQFYILLCYAFLEDIFVLYNLVFVFVTSPLSFITFYIGILISSCFVIISIYLWFEYYWKSDNRQKNNQVVKSTHDSNDILKYNGCGLSSSTRIKSQSLLWKWMPRITFLAFLISIPWEFVRLYKFQVAEKMTHISKGIPEECVLEKMTYMQYLKSMMRWYFSWSPDACFQYHKAVHVDPVWEVTPLLALTSVISNCIVRPFENLCHGLGRAFRLFFSEIPAQWQPIMLLVMLIVLLVIIIMIFGYRIHFPFIKLEPRTPVRSTVKIKGKTRQREGNKELEDTYEVDSSQDLITVD